MKKTQTPDVRPAIVYDSSKEVRLTIDALTEFKHIMPHFYEYNSQMSPTRKTLQKLIKEYSKVLKIFNKN